MKVVNKSVGRDYEIIEGYEAGITLLGAEVKSVKAGRILFDGAHVHVEGKHRVEQALFGVLRDAVVHRDAIRGLGGVGELGFANAFEMLAQPQDAGCGCNPTTELNYLLHFRPEAIFNALELV